ncbi:Uncharacterised protein [Mycobacteroides abscessus subsp. abscessus]|nr:Uncharacterised protein [Mycobacteroides abscessus subsp. abscessus]
MLLLIFIIFTYFTITMLICKGRAEPLLLTIIGCSQILVGYYLINSDNVAWLYYFFSIISFISGYFFVIFFLRKSKYEHNIKFPHKNNKLIYVDKVFITLVLLLVFYHFVVGGIPLLSNNVEIDRFSFNSSGLGGIPSRMVLFGLPFIVIYATILNKRYKNLFPNKYLIIIWCLFFIFKILSGFKGVIVEIVYFSLFVFAIKGEAVSIRKLISFKYFLYIGIAILFAGFMSLKYTSLGLNTLESVINYLALRLTVMPAEPGYFAINNINTLNYWGSPLLNEFIYFIEKYSKIQLTISNEFPIDMIVSSNIYNTALNYSNFIVPVTVGGYAVFYLSFGLYLSFFVMFIAGFIYKFLLIKVNVVRSPFTAAVFGLIIYRMHIFILSGGFWYFVINTFATVVILSTLWFIAYQIVSILSKTQNKLRY